MFPFVVYLTGSNPLLNEHFPGHRHHRSTDQGIDEEEPEDEIKGDEPEEEESRKRRDAPLPSFPSDHDSEHSNSVGTFVITCYHWICKRLEFPCNHRLLITYLSLSAIRVKRVSRAGSSHKVRTLNKNRGNSKAGETTQNDSPPSGAFSP